MSAQLLIGQEYSPISDADIKSRLGSHNDLPPNLTPATEHTFWALFFDGGFTHQPRQPRVQAAAWRHGKCIRRVEHTTPWRDTMLLTNVKLLIRADLSGLMVVFDRTRTYPRDNFARYFYSFSACEHLHVVGKELGNCYVESKCLDCGFTTRVDSGD